MSGLHLTLLCQVSSASLQQKGMPQSYIDQLKPVAIVMSANQIKVANGATCSVSSGSCSGDLRPNVTLGLIDAAGTETVTTYDMTLKDSGYHSERWLFKCYL